MNGINKKTQLKSSLLLLLTAAIWGCAFVAQSVSMDYIGPLTFIFLRCFIGGLVLLPVIAVSGRGNRENVRTDGAPSGWGDPRLWKAGVLCGLFLFGGNYFQQTGIQYTTVGKAGFITSFYIIIVPILGLFLGRKCGVKIWLSVLIALCGLYFLCMSGRQGLQKGDVLVFLCAFFFSAQILTIDHYAQGVDLVKMSCIEFFVGALLGFAGMLAAESFDPAMVRAAAVPVLYTGVLSTGVGYTLQTIGQRGLHPTVASLLMSFESVFSALAGFLLLHQAMSFREILGSVLMFAAIILAQLDSSKGLRFD